MIVKKQNIIQNSESLRKQPDDKRKQTQKKQVKPLFTWFLNAKTAILTLWKNKLGNPLKKKVQAIRLSSTYHQSDKTTVKQFFGALAGDLKLLKRYPWGDAKTALMMLYDEYGRLSENKEYSRELERQKSSAVIYNRITRLKTALKTNDVKAIRRLAGTDNRKAAEGKLKLWATKYENMNKPLETGSKKAEGIESLCVELSRYAHYKVSPETTVSEFAAVVRNYNKEIESKKKK